MSPVDVYPKFRSEPTNHGIDGLALIREIFDLERHTGGILPVVSGVLYSFLRKVASERGPLRPSIPESPMQMRALP